MTELPTEGKFYVHCAGGYRSVIAASILIWWFPIATMAKYAAVRNTDNFFDFILSINFKIRKNEKTF